MYVCVAGWDRHFISACHWLLTLDIIYGYIFTTCMNMHSVAFDPNVFAVLACSPNQLTRRQELRQHFWECARKARYGSFNLPRLADKSCLLCQPEREWEGERECNALECFLCMITPAHTHTHTHTHPQRTSICVKLLFAIRPLATSQIQDTFLWLSLS